MPAIAALALDGASGHLHQIDCSELVRKAQVHIGEATDGGGRSGAEVAAVVRQTIDLPAVDSSEESE